MTQKWQKILGSSQCVKHNITLCASSMSTGIIIFIILQLHMTVIIWPCISACILTYESVNLTSSTVSDNVTEHLTPDNSSLLILDLVAHGGGRALV
jgi:hypothetical protein